MAKNRNALGNGLEYLLADMDEVYANLDSKKIYQIEISKINPNPMQPRKEFNKESLQNLAQSIKEHGLLQPIIVHDSGDNKFTLIAGERRLRAVKLLQHTNIEAIILDDTQYKMRELALIENIQRENLNPIELALCYQALITEHNLTQEQLSQKIQISRTQITNTLRLLELSENTLQALQDNKITQGHAKMLVGLTPNQETIALQTILGQKLNVRQTEKMIKNIKKPQTNESNPAISLNAQLEDPAINNILKKLQNKLLHQYNITCKIKQDKISICCSNIEALEKLLNRL